MASVFFCVTHDAFLEVGMGPGCWGLPVIGREWGEEVGARGLTVTVTSDARHLHCSWSSVQPPKNRPAKGCEATSSLDTWSQSPRVLSPRPVILCEITRQRTPLVAGPRPNSGKESWALCLCSGHTTHYGWGKVILQTSPE